MTTEQISAKFREGLALFPTTDTVQIAGAVWTGSVASVRRTESFGVGGAFAEHDAILTAAKPADAEEPKTGMRVIWKSQTYHIASVEIVASGALHVISLNRGNPPRGS